MGGIYLFSNCSSHLFAMQTNRFTMPIITRFLTTSNIYFLRKISQNRHTDYFSVVNWNLLFHLTIFCLNLSEGVYSVVSLSNWSISISATFIQASFNSKSNSSILLLPLLLFSPMQLTSHISLLQSRPHSLG